MLFRAPESTVAAPMKRSFSAGLARLGPFLQPALVLALALAASGCTKKIGDSCVLSTDCSVNGGRVCDTSQPGGYCTQLGCNTGSCPDDAVCVSFQATVPGCAYNDYDSPSRTGRSFCEAHCDDDSDCRQSEGYICASPTGAPWNGAILDNNQNQKVCIIANPAVAVSSMPVPDAAICQAGPLDGGGYVPADASFLDAGPADGGDAGVTDAGSVDAGDAGGNDAGDTGSVDAGDAGEDAGAAVDAGPVDAASGD